jgi:hypothetical protein
VEIEEPEMEEAPEWLEEHADDLGKEAASEEEDVPLLVDTKVEEENDLPVQPMFPPPPSKVRPTVGLGSVGTGRWQLILPSTSPPSLSTSIGAVGASTPSSSQVPPLPPTAAKGRVVPFTRKRGRGNQ